jgi:hypothetical protein
MIIQKKEKPIFLASFNVSFSTSLERNFFFSSEFHLFIETFCVFFFLLFSSRVFPRCVVSFQVRQNMGMDVVVEEK